MNEHREGKPRWAIALFVILMAAVVGMVAFRMGVTHGVALSGIAVDANDGVEAGRAIRPHLYAYPWHGPWGFGPFGLLFPFLFIGMGLVAMRILFGGGPCRGRRWRGAYDGPLHVPRRFEEWHRREHERMREHDRADSVDRADRTDSANQNDRSDRNTRDDSVSPRPPTA